MGGGKNPNNKAKTSLTLSVAKSDAGGLKKFPQKQKQPASATASSKPKNNKNKPAPSTTIPPTTGKRERENDDLETQLKTADKLPTTSKNNKKPRISPPSSTAQTRTNKKTKETSDEFVEEDDDVEENDDMENEVDMSDGDDVDSFDEEDFDEADVEDMSDLDDQDVDDDDGGEEDEEGDEDEDEEGEGKGKGEEGGKKKKSVMASTIARLLAKDLKEDEKSRPILAKRKSIERKIDATKLEAKARRVLRAARATTADRERVRASDFLARSSEDPAMLEYERKLKKVATRGVVKLFNAIRLAQKAKEEEKVGSVKEKATAVPALSKSTFLEMLKKPSETDSSTSPASTKHSTKSTSKSSSSAAGGEGDGEGVAWTRSDYMTRQSGKHWDEEDDEDDEEGEEGLGFA
ncbi:hypothetical protein HK102_009136 [Quaeritorhiza haematococci]|nr:hypothetical protein HK102_009136 [Quaeritorhiza haematococci]